MIDQHGCEVISDHCTSDVEEIPEPAAHHSGLGINNLDEDTLEDLCAVKEKVIAEPAARSADKTVPVLCADEFERLDIVTGDVVFLLRKLQLGICKFQLVDSMIDEVERDGANEGEGDTEGPLCAEFAVRRASAAMEHQEANNEDALVCELTPSLRLTQFILETLLA
jgi:hypothetical protein